MIKLVAWFRKFSDRRARLVEFRKLVSDLKFLVQGRHQHIYILELGSRAPYRMAFRGRLSREHYRLLRSLRLRGHRVWVGA